MPATAGSFDMPSVLEAKEKAQGFKDQQPEAQSNPNDFAKAASDEIKAKGKDESAAQMSTASENAAAGVDWGYDKLDKKREGAAAKVDRLEGQDSRTHLENHELQRAQGADGRIDRRQAAREGMEDTFDINDPSTYNTEAFGTKQFGNKDLEFLQEQGATKKQQKAFVEHFASEGNIGQKMRMDEDLAKWTGDQHIGPMEEGSKVSDFDFGGKIRQHEVEYLRNQGFKDKQIFGHAQNSLAGLNESGKDKNNKDYMGLGAHRWMDEMGLYAKDGGTPSPEPSPDPVTDPTPEPTPDPPPTADPVTPTPGAPTAPDYGYSVQGNPYSSENPGYYYGTERAQDKEQLAADLSKASADAFYNGLQDIETWQQAHSENMQYHNNILHEVYKSMGLVPSQAA